MVENLILIHFFKSKFDKFVTKFHTHKSIAHNNSISTKYPSSFPPINPPLSLRFVYMIKSVKRKMKNFPPLQLNLSRLEI